MKSVGIKRFGKKKNQSCGNIPILRCKLIKQLLTIIAIGTSSNVIVTKVRDAYDKFPDVFVWVLLLIVHT